MWLVICAEDDLPALWAYQGLRARGLEPLELVGAASLGSALRWEHRVQAGEGRTTLTLADGRTLRTQEARGTLNRLGAVPSGALSAAHPAERAYMIQEIQAFFLSWLHTLPPPVLNRPTPHGLSGRWRPCSEWTWLAWRSGLPTTAFRQSCGDLAEGDEQAVLPGATVRTVLVVGDRVVGTPAPEEIGAGCRSLARLAGADLLGVDFVPGAAGPWTFAGATTLPDLRLGGAPLLDALAAALRGDER